MQSTPTLCVCVCARACIDVRSCVGIRACVAARALDSWACSVRMEQCARVESERMDKMLERRAQLVLARNHRCYMGHVIHEWARSVSAKQVHRHISRSFARERSIRVFSPVRPCLTRLCAFLCLFVRVFVQRLQRRAASLSTRAYKDRARDILHVWGAITQVSRRVRVRVDKLLAKYKMAWTRNAFKGACAHKCTHACSWMRTFVPV